MSSFTAVCFRLNVEGKPSDGRSVFVLYPQVEAAIKARGLSLALVTMQT